MENKYIDSHKGGIDPFYLLGGKWLRTDEIFSYYREYPNRLTERNKEYLFRVGPTRGASEKQIKGFIEQVEYENVKRLFIYYGEYPNKLTEEDKEYLLKLCTSTRYASREWFERFIEKIEHKKEKNLDREVMTN